MRSPAFALLLATAVLSPLSALADTYTYTYSGNPFNAFDGSVYTSSDFVSGEFTVSAPLASSTPLRDFAPLSFSFSDGLHTISSTDPGVSSEFAVATDSAGDITHWIVDTRLFVGVEEFIASDNRGGGSTPNDYGELTGPTGNGYAVIAYGQNINSPGAWTETTNITAAAPEPASLMLLATGLATTGNLLRRRFQTTTARNA